MHFSNRCGRYWPRLVASGAIALVIASMALPVAAQDDTSAGRTSFLPIVNQDGGAVTSTEISMTGVLSIGEEPVFSAPPKDSARAADAAVATDSPALPPVSDVEPAAAEGWTTLVDEGFEGGSWPRAGWSVYDSNGTTGGTYTWDDETYRPYRGTASAWPAGSALNPASNLYPNLMRTWMVYGPVDLSNAAQANFTFQYWNQSELNYDWLFWAASPDGTRFYGNWVSGTSGGWRPGVMDLASVPGYGSMLGDASVFIGFYFYSDGSTRDVGPFVDDLFVQKMACPGGFTALWYNSLTRSPTTQRAITCENAPFQRNWGTESAPWTAADNWSLVLRGKFNFATARTYTFMANSDDGVRVWVDNVQVIDAWTDHSATTTYTGTKALTAGTHEVYVEYYDRTGPAQLYVRWQ